jgi:hypothetical protein
VRPPLSLPWFPQEKEENKVKNTNHVGKIRGALKCCLFIAKKCCTKKMKTSVAPKR